MPELALRSGLLQDLFSEAGYVITPKTALNFIRDSGKSSESAARNLIRAVLYEGSVGTPAHSRAQAFQNLWGFLAGIEDVTDFIGSDEEELRTSDARERAESLIDDALNAHPTLAEILWE